MRADRREDLARGIAFRAGRRIGRYLTYESWTPDGREATTVRDGHLRRVLSSFPGFWSSWSPDSTKLATWESAIHSVDGAFLTNVAQPEGWSISGDQYGRLDR
jgi:hypothetical protein